MTKYNSNDSRDEVLDVCCIFERITGKTLHHGETDYDLTPVYEQMERDMTLVDEIIRAGGAEAEYAERMAEEGKPLSDETRKEFAFLVADICFMCATE